MSWQSLSICVCMSLTLNFSLSITYSLISDRIVNCVVSLLKIPMGTIDSCKINLMLRFNNTLLNRNAFQIINATTVEMCVYFECVWMQYSCQYQKLYLCYETYQTPHSFRIHWSRSSYHIDWNNIGMWFENARLAFNMTIKIKLWTRSARVQLHQPNPKHTFTCTQNIVYLSKHRQFSRMKKKRISSIWLHLRSI